MFIIYYIYIIEPYSSDEEYEEEVEYEGYMDTDLEDHEDLIMDEYHV